MKIDLQNSHRTECCLFFALHYIATTAKLRQIVHPH